MSPEQVMAIFWRVSRWTGLELAWLRNWQNLACNFMKVLHNWTWFRAPDAALTEQQECCLCSCLLFVNVDKHIDARGEPYFLTNVSAGILVLCFAVTIETHATQASTRPLPSFAIWRYAYRLVPAVKGTYLNHVQLGKFIYINIHQARR
jgi:hypothetical protein